jgi:hypothetical protein
MTVTVIHYCCDKFPSFNSGVPRYDYHIQLCFPNRVFFQGPHQKVQMINYIKNNNNPCVVITDNHLACDVPTETPTILVHHGCAETHQERDPTWNNTLCINGQRNMFNIRNPENTFIISCSQFCTDEFTKHFGEKYKKFPNKLILHTSELEPCKQEKKYNKIPVILGNWSCKNKGSQSFNKLRETLKGEFEFRQLSTKSTNSLTEHNDELKQIYGECDIYLQLSLAEGNSYATLDAFSQNLLVCGTDVGLLYELYGKGIGKIFDYRKRDDIEMVATMIRDLWNDRDTYKNKSINWFLDNVKLDDWKNRMIKIVEDFSSNYCMKNLPVYGRWSSMELGSIREDSIVYSFGAGEDISYEFLLSGLKNCEIHIFDPTPRAVEHYDYCKNLLNSSVNPINSLRFGGGDKRYNSCIQKSGANINKLFYHDYGLYDKDDSFTFYHPKNTDHVSLSIDNLQNTTSGIQLNVKKIDTIMNELGHTHIDVIKLNIEGAEVVSLIHMLKNTNIRPTYISVKFELIRDKLTSHTSDLQNELMSFIRETYSIVSEKDVNYTFKLK